MPTMSLETATWLSRTGAKIYVHEASGAEFPHEIVHGGDVLELGNLRLTVMHTPGHTPESITLLVTDTTRSDQPWLALTGDTLFVGDMDAPTLWVPKPRMDLPTICITLCSRRSFR